MIAGKGAGHLGSLVAYVPPVAGHPRFVKSKVAARQRPPGGLAAAGMSPAKAKTVHGGESFARLTSIHPAQGKTPDAKVICQTKVCPRRVLRLWDAWIGLCKRLTRWSRSRSRDEPLQRPLTDVSLNHSSPKGGDSRDSTTKKGNAFPFIMLEDGTPMPRNEVLKLGLVRFKGAPARRRRETWTVHGGDTFASLSCRPQHTAKA